MDPYVFNHLESLNKLTSHWRIKVRLTRAWPTTSYDGTLLGFNFIFLDNQNYHVHAFVRTEILNLIGNDLRVGNIYEISDFYVRQSYGKHRAVRSPLSILFSAMTTVHILDNEDETIPKYKFDLLQVQQIIERADYYHLDQTFTIDVIGVVENLQELQMISKSNGATSPLIKFRLGDGSQSLRVDLLGPLTEELNSLFEDVIERPFIVILASVRLQIYRGEIILTNVSSSKVYINPNVLQVFSMRNRLDNDGYEEPPNA